MRLIANLRRKGCFDSRKTAADSRIAFNDFNFFSRCGRNIAPIVYI